MKLTEMMKIEPPTTMLAYCAPGVGKSTFLGLIAEQSKGKTLVLDIDRSFINAMRKDEVVHNFDNIEVWQIDNVNTWQSWCDTMSKLKDNKEFENICVDNLSELERCLLADLGRQGKNKGVPAMADYQYIQFRLVDSLRFLKNVGNVYLTAWETIVDFESPDGSKYSRVFPKIMSKIVDNICGLCDIVARIIVRQDDGERGLVLEATQNIYAKNQRDTRKSCNVKDFLKNVKKEESAKKADSKNS